MKTSLNDYAGKIVLITGGTMGIGLATGLAFAKRGAHCILTNKWGNADQDEIKNLFEREGAQPPRILQSDAADSADIQNMLTELKSFHEKIDIFVSNVSFAQLTRKLDDYSERGLFKSIDYCVWPLIEITRGIKKTFGRYPEYVIGLSSHGPSGYHVNYDFVAAVKAVLETFIKYLNYRLQDHEVKLNVVRARFVKTNSLWATLGREFEEFGHRYDTPGLFIEAEEVADAILALCCGLMDGVSGQVINVDKGSTFADNIMRFYEDRERLAL